MSRFQVIAASTALIAGGVLAGCGINDVAPIDEGERIVLDIYDGGPELPAPVRGCSGEELGVIDHVDRTFSLVRPGGEVLLLRPMKPREENLFIVTLSSDCSSFRAYWTRPGWMFGHDALVTVVDIGTGTSGDYRIREKDWVEAVTKARERRDLESADRAEGDG